MTTHTPTRRRLAAVLATAVVAPVCVAAVAATGPAHASAPEHHMTAHASDPTPSSDETFRVRGRLSFAGDPVIGHRVKIQVRRPSGWDTLPGATMMTNENGRYGLQVALHRTGERTLRALGVVPGVNARERFTVTVLSD